MPHYHDYVTYIRPYPSIYKDEEQSMKPWIIFFSFHRWKKTGSIACMTSWPNSALQHPPTSTLAQCLWGAHSNRAATSLSPPPLSLRLWVNSWSEYSQTSTPAAGRWDHSGDVMSEQRRLLAEFGSAAWLYFMLSDRSLRVTVFTVIRSWESL